MAIESIDLGTSNFAASLSSGIDRVGQELHIVVIDIGGIDINRRLFAHRAERNALSNGSAIHS